jgi:hypothetical protein
MASEPFLKRCRTWYAKLVRLYPKEHRERFGEGMEQTFNDLCRERVNAGTGLFGFALWMFFETSAAIIRENATTIVRRSMTRSSTTFLKVAIFLVAIAALAVCVFGLPGIVGQEAARHPESRQMPYLFLVCVYILSVPFFVGLYQVFKLLNYIDMNNAYSESSAGTLKRLKYSAITISALMVAGIATLMVLSRGKGEDITGIVAPALLITIVSGVVAIVAAVLQKRVQKGLEISR